MVHPIANSLAVAAGLWPLALAAACPSASCSGIAGDIDIVQYQLYPENFDVDHKSCVAYLGGMYNESLVAYDVATKSTQVFTFQGLTLSGKGHSSGIRYHPQSGHVFLTVTPANLFATNGLDRSDDDLLIRYNPTTETELYRLNLSQVSNHQFAGYQDLVVDDAGNAFAIGSFPANIIRVDSSGKNAQDWYTPQPANTTLYGYAGSARVENTLLVNDNREGKLWRFNLGDNVGNPQEVTISPAMEIPHSDGIDLPPKYRGTVLLVTENQIGIQVFRSNDGWKTAQFLGLVPNDEATSATEWPVATRQIGNSIYKSIQYFFDPSITSYGAGNRTVFPLVDITSQVDALLK